MKFLPDVTWPPPNTDTAGLASRDTLNSTASKNKQTMALVSAGDAVRVVLGEDRIGADVLNVISHQGYLVVQAVWSYAPGTTGIEGVQGVTFNDEDIPAGVVIKHYLGLPVQPIDPWMVAAFSDAGKVYADTLPNVAYSVFKIPSDVVADMNLPNIAAVVKGGKFHDPRTGVRAWTENPSLILAGFISDPWGMDQPVNWDTVAVCADEDDRLINGKPNRTMGLTMDKPMRTDQWLETLRTYASCWVVPGDAGAELVPDRITAVSRTISHAAGDIKAVTGFEFRELSNTPNVVRVTYTDESSVPWRKDVYAEVALPEVLNGAPRRESVIQLEGFHDYSEALRAATERLNKLTLADLTLTLVMHDEGVGVKVGDVVEVTTDFGIVSKPFRVLGVTHDYGECTLSLTEYDPASYSSVVGTTPTYQDVSLPSPTNPPAPANVAAVEELYSLRDGTIASRLNITWDDTTYMWRDSYYVEVVQGTEVVWKGSTRTPGFRTGAVQDDVQLITNVYIVSRVGTMSPAATVHTQTLGKFALPSDVPYIRGYEVGGEVRLEVGPAIDKDLRGLEVRYGAVGVAWGDAKLVDFVPTAPGVGARLLSKIIPAGTWDILCCALDSVEQYSANPARMTLTVTSDASAFLVDNHQFINPTVSGMAEYTLWAGDTVRRFVSEDNLPFSKFSAPLGTYTQPLASYCSQPSEFVTEGWDFGTGISGDWRGSTGVSAISGSPEEHIDLSTVSPAGPWLTYTPANARTTARYARLRVSAMANEAMSVKIPDPIVRVDAVPKTEYAKVPTTSSATSYARITLENDYVALKGPPKITVLGNTAASSTVDNIQVGDPTTFDVYIFNSAGIQIARDFMWEFNGV